ncbi:MAG TPA: aldo/keto reductase [Lapidilactobacillus dextrinicus]|uniref:Aldo keto reductase family protein n=2 Tax=Lapidilactobacillus dextrinicus TaxID=51664 RepID=A0A0R2BU71_9LACO|nr:aldo/keto reductase [Lapidilactobacillus dextrinicus]KRM79803.1 aldo keto reductase family protein [Lapidilactobacillus dextrinicus DSM 20335]QFG46411.1 aldo/keto reductase [Lapidilactobacillus dextrinicus]HJE14879.1 aldo/keto reductase [Lapidilactobacillus dextrinicus]
MRQVSIGLDNINASEIALGLMRIADKTTDETVKLLETAVEHGVNFFDNADIYGGGDSERRFGDALAASTINRDDILIQTKVGIGKNEYDFSKQHILEGLNGSLERMGLDHVDFLLLHRPDALMEPDEIAEAFFELQKSGKVREFGVSNFNPMQIELLQQAVAQPLVINQLQLGLMHTGMIDFGFHTNMTDPRSTNHDGGIYEYSRLNNMTIQAWSPYQYGFFEGVFIDNPKFPEVNAMLHKIADKYHSNVNAVAAAWILRLPTSVQVIAGTTNPERLAQICEADQVQLTRSEWYDLYLAAGNDLP